MASKAPAKDTVCHYCRRQLAEPTSPARTAYTRDHFIPKHLGGRRTVACCRQCNNLKGPLHIKEWREVMTQFPKWWREFEHRGDLIKAQRAMAWQHAKPVQQSHEYPFRVSAPQLCRGLTVDVSYTSEGN